MVDRLANPVTPARQPAGYANSRIEPEPVQPTATDAARRRNQGIGSPAAVAGQVVRPEKPYRGHLIQTSTRLQTSRPTQCDAG